MTTETATPTGTETGTPTATPTGTETATPTATPTGTATATPEPMTITERWQGRRGSNTDQTRTRVRVFQVVTDSATTDSTHIEAHPDIPKKWDTHPNDSAVYCKNIECVNDDSDYTVWTVTCTYESLRFGETPSANPVSKTPVIRWGSQSKDIVFDRDVDGTPVVNSAGQPFDPPPTKRKNLVLLTIDRNESTSSFGPTTISTFQDTINSADVTVAGYTISAEDGLMTAVEGTLTKSNGYTYYATHYEVLIDPDGHAEELVDAGFYQIDGGVPVKITDTAGKDIELPWKLNGSGVALSEADQTDPDEYHTLSFDKYATANWSTLSFPALAQ